MDKKKKSEPKKILVRNTELPVPKTRLIFDGKGKPEEKTKKDEFKGQKVKHANTLKLHSPELHSTLKISEKIDKVGKAKSQQFEKDVAFCEKVTRKINFPADKAIYKDLIPLQVSTKAPPTLTSREPLPQKDQEPSLLNYTKPGKSGEYIYLPSVKSDMHSSTSQVDSLHLYKITQMYSQ